MWVIAGFSHNVTPMYPKRFEGREQVWGGNEFVWEDGVRTQCVCVLINLFPGGRNWSEMMRFKRVNGCAALRLSSVEWASRVRGWANGRRHGNQITSPSPESLGLPVMTSWAREHRTERTWRPQTSLNKRKVDFTRPAWMRPFILHLDFDKSSRYMALSRNCDYSDSINTCQ